MLHAEIWQAANDFEAPFFWIVIVMLMATGTAFLLLRLPSEVEGVSAFTSWADVTRRVAGTPVAAFIAAFSALQFTVAALTDDTYRGEFLEDIVGEIREALAVLLLYLECLVAPGPSGGGDGPPRPGEARGGFCRLALPPSRRRGERAHAKRTDRTDGRGRAAGRGLWW